MYPGMIGKLYKKNQEREKERGKNRFGKGSKMGLKKGKNEF